MAQVYDSLQNLISGLGTSRDKSVYTEFTRTHLPDEYLGTLYRHWVFAKAVDIPVDDMLSKGRTVQAPGEIDKDQLEEFYRAEQDLNLWQVIGDSMKWARLYGGSVILLDVKDPAELDQPLVVESLQKDCIVDLIPLDRTDITPYHITSLSTGSMRKPSFYQLSDGSMVHPSRIIRFDGIRLPWQELERNNYWGASIVERIYDEATASKTVLQSIASMIFESNIDVVSIKGLFTKFLTGKGKDSLIQRFMLANLSKSINKTTLIDADQETFTRHPMNFSGLPPLIPEFLNVVAAAVDIPITRFLGQSAKGLNATGEGDLRNYYDMLTSTRENTLSPQMRQLDQVLTRHVFGEMPQGWFFDWNPLWTMSDMDKAAMDKTNAETDAILDGLGAIQTHHIAGRVMECGRYDMLDAEFVEELKAIDEMKIEEDDFGTETETENQTDDPETSDDDQLLPGTETDSVRSGEEDR
jgi:uncharacterized protein